MNKKFYKSAVEIEKSIRGIKKEVLIKKVDLVSNLFWGGLKMIRRIRKTASEIERSIEAYKADNLLKNQGFNLRWI